MCTNESVQTYVGHTCYGIQGTAVFEHAKGTYIPSFKSPFSANMWTDLYDKGYQWRK